MNKKNYRNYVGPDARYDLLASLQFNLLTSMGLREKHKLLDFGCGSLRAGRLFIPYLNKGHYFGVEPNKWLIDEGIKNNLGISISNVKKPYFDNNNNFEINFKNKFDYILAQSIFSHTSINCANKLIFNFKNSLMPNGYIVANFKIKRGLKSLINKNDFEKYDKDWVYPKCVSYDKKTILSIAKNNNLHCIELPYYHPTLTWFVFTHDMKNLKSKIFTKNYGYIKDVNI